MPTHEPIQNTLIPKVEAAPIPVRTVVTRAKLPVVKDADAGIPVQADKVNNSGAEATAPKTEESVKLSAKLSAQARQEQAFRQREAAVKAREAAAEAALADAQKYRELKAKLSEKDFTEAEALGLDYETYTKYRLDKINGEDPQQAKIQELEKKIEALAKGSEELASAQYEETIADYKKEITKLVSEDPEFSTIKGVKGGEAAVLQLIVDTFEEDGEELTISEAAKLVEEMLVERGKIYTSLPKFKKEAAPTEKVLPRPVVGKTLTNNLTVGGNAQPLKSLQSLSEAERYAEARRRALAKRQG